MKVGTKVKKNLKTWKRTDFDRWIDDDDIGEIIGIEDDGTVDVQWPHGKAYQQIDELLIVQQIDTSEWTSEDFKTMDDFFNKYGSKE